VFWVGGFLFYTSIVVPIGTDQLGRVGQGFITREVTRAINVSAAVALTLLLAETWLTADPGVRRRWARRGLWLGMALCQAALFYLHPMLDGYLDVETASIRQRPTFYQLHRVYLWTHTAQFALAVIELGLMLAAWRAADVRAFTKPDAVPASISPAAPADAPR
jgi:hypothetical protein